jgi:putative transcriptional regulator
MVRVIALAGLVAGWMGLHASASIVEPPYASDAVGLQERGALMRPAAGRLLVASRRLTDPNFSETVVLLIEYSDKGATGIVLNRQSTVPLSRLLPDIGSLRSEPARVFQGGPVSLERISAFVRRVVAPFAAHQVLEDVYLINTRDALEDVMAEATSADRVRIYAGYAGWSGGQLDRELLAGHWHVLPGVASVVFDANVDTVWQRQLRRTESVLAWMPPRPAGHPGSSQTGG